MVCFRGCWRNGASVVGYDKAPEIVRWSLPLDAVFSVLLAEYECHRVSPHYSDGRACAGETFRHSFGDDVGIHRPQLPANCCPDVGSERGRGFALVVIVRPEDICRACRNKLIETCTSPALQGQ